MDLVDEFPLIGYMALDDLTLTSVFVGLTPAYINNLDALRVCPGITLARLKEMYINLIFTNCNFHIKDNPTQQISAYGGLCVNLYLL